MITIKIVGRATLVTTLAIFFALFGCKRSSHHSLGHPDVVLRDNQGDPMDPESTVPYSPRRTCGPCHDIDLISNAYHFQQGRTDLAGNLVMKDDYFEDGRTWLSSPGMYGKW